MAKTTLATLLSLLVFLLSCQQPESTEQQIQKEVEALDTPEKQTAYLLALQEQDQYVRHFETQQLKQHGYESTEHLESINKMITVDRLNLVKLEAYLAAYGHPRKEIHGKDASSVPQLIIHHASSETSPRRRHFPIIYQAYKNGDIRDTEMTFYLNRMYEMQYHQRIKWDRPFRVEEELDTLFKALDLIEIAKQIDAEGEIK